jgi:hypothetical protein
VGQVTVPPDLQGQFGGVMSASYNGEPYDASSNYIVVQVISGGYGEMIAKIGYYPNRKYACTAELALESANPYSKNSYIVLKVLPGADCLTTGTRVTFTEADSEGYQEKVWLIYWTDGPYKVDTWLTRKN